MDDKPLQALSYTQLSMLQQCGEKYRRRYLEKERLPPGPAMIRGTAQHAAQLYDLQAKRVTGELADLGTITDLARQTVIDSFAGPVALSADDVAMGVDMVRSDTVDAAVRLTKLHHEAVAPDIQPERLEVKAEVLLPEIRRPLLGFIDVIEVNGTIRDTKNTAKSPNADAAEKSDQLVWYAMAYEAATGESSPLQQLDHLVDTKQPKYVPLSVSNGPAEFAVLRRRLQAAERSIDAEMFLPANPDSWWCSAKWCGFHATCPYVKNRTTVIMPPIQAQFEER